MHARAECMCVMHVYTDASDRNESVQKHTSQQMKKQKDKKLPLYS